MARTQERPADAKGTWAGADCFQVENAACWRCSEPIWFDPERREPFCPNCDRVPGPTPKACWGD